MPQNLFSAPPALKDLLELFRKDLLLNLFSHHIGRLVSVNTTNQTCQAQLVYKKSFLVRNPDNTFTQQQQDYPVLVDCPMIILGGGTASLTFPFAPGDECLLIFNDRDIDNWFAGNNGAPVASPRLHSFTDAIALVGVRSTPNVLKSYDAVNAVLQNGTTKVAVGPALITLANNLYTLNGLLQELVTDVKNLVTATAAITVSGVTTGGGVSGTPVNAAAINAVATSLTATATKISGLLA